MKKRTLANGSWVAFSLPAIFFVLAFMLYPVIYSLVLSFYSHQGLMSTFVGIGFRWNILELTVQYVVVFSDPGAHYAASGSFLCIFTSDRWFEGPWLFPNGTVPSLYYVTGSILDCFPDYVPV